VESKQDQREEEQELAEGFVMWKDILKAPFDTREYEEATFSMTGLRKFLYEFLDGRIRAAIDGRGRGQRPRRNEDGRTYTVTINKYNLNRKNSENLAKLLNKDRTDFTERVKKIFREEYNMVNVKFNRSPWYEDHYGVLEFTLQIKDGL